MRESLGKNVSKNARPGLQSLLTKGRLRDPLEQSGHNRCHVEYLPVKDLSVYM